MQLKLNFTCFFFVCVLMFGASACKSKKEALNTTGKENSIVNTKVEGYVKGVVKKYEVDGCNYMIFLENGTKLNPINLEEQYQIENTTVWIKYKNRDEVNTICMAGTVVEITSIKTGEK